MRREIKVLIYTWKWFARLCFLSRGDCDVFLLRSEEKMNEILGVSCFFLCHTVYTEYNTLIAV